MYFLILQKNKNDYYNILTLLLSLKKTYENLNIIIACEKELKELIELYSYEISREIEFINIEISCEKSLDIQYIINFINISKQLLSKYNELIYLKNDMISKEPLIIKHEIKKQEIGFIKTKITNHSNEEYIKYNFDVLYISNTKYIDSIIEIFNDTTSLFKEKEINEQEDEKKYKEEINKIKRIFIRLPYLLSLKDKLEYFLSEYTILELSYFFAYSNSWKLDLLNKKDFNYNNNVINFVNIPLNVNSHPLIKKTSNVLLEMFINTSYIYSFLLNIKLNKGKNILIKPVPEYGIAHWNRKKTSKIYNLTELIQKNSDFIISKYDNNFNYFVYSCCVLYDSEKTIYLTNDILKYKKVLLFNYSNELLDELKKSKIDYRFITYMCPYPEILDDYSKDLILKDEEFMERENNIFKDEIGEFKNEQEYKDYLKEISEYKFLLITDKCNDIQSRLLECIALGIIPIINNQLKIFELEENKHYITEINNNQEIDYTQIHKNCINIYNQSFTPERIHDKILMNIINLT